MPNHLLLEQGQEQPEEDRQGLSLLTWRCEPATGYIALRALRVVIVNSECPQRGTFSRTNRKESWLFDTSRTNRKESWLFDTTTLQNLEAGGGCRLKI